MSKLASGTYLRWTPASLWWSVSFRAIWNSGSDRLPASSVS